MRVLAALLACAALLLVTTSARGAVEEVPLPAEAKAPLALAFDAGGKLWLTLDGTWGVGRYDTATGQLAIARIATPKSDDQDTLLALAFAPDGSVWTGSATHLHRVSPANMSVASFRLPGRSELSGGVYVAPDGGVWYAAVTAERLVRLDPATGSFAQVMSPFTPFGPLHIEAGPLGVYLTATYADTYAALDPTNRTLTPGLSGALNAPVGLDQAGGELWAAEMGDSTVARVDLASGAVERFPTSPSPYYPVSGPSGVRVARDGGVWFVEHFADKVARLDPGKRTLHEWEVPSAPGTNVQNLAEAPDGRFWFAEWSTSRLGHVRDDGRQAAFTLPGPVTVQRGGTQRVPLTLQGEVVVNGPEPNLTVRWEDGAVVVDATKAAAGSYNVLVAVKEGKENLGRYLAVQVVEPPGSKASPGVETALVLAVAAAVAWSQRRRA